MSESRDALGYTCFLPVSLSMRFKISLIYVKAQAAQIHICIALEGVVPVSSPLIHLVYLFLCLIKHRINALASIVIVLKTKKAWTSKRFKVKLSFPIDENRTQVILHTIASNQRVTILPRTLPHLWYRRAKYVKENKSDGTNVQGPHIDKKRHCRAVVNLTKLRGEKDNREIQKHEIKWALR